MKKTIAFIAIYILLAFTPEKKTLHVEGDFPAWQALLDCVEKSTAPHTQVKAVQEWIVGQLQKQLADTSKVLPEKKPK